jgi:hypothetical protein
MDYSGYPFDETPAWVAALAVSFDKCVAELHLEFICGKFSVEEFGQAVLDLRAENNVKYLDTWVKEIS